MTRNRKLTVAAAAIAIAGASIPGTALAAVSAPQTAAAPVTSTACTAVWNGEAINGDLSGFSQIEWTSNSCGDEIETRSYCSEYVTGVWVVSPATAKVGDWVQAVCTIQYYVDSAQYRELPPGGTWSAWTTYYTNPYA